MVSDLVNPYVGSFVVSFGVSMLVLLFARWLDNKITEGRLKKALLEELRTNLEILKKLVKGIQEGGAEYISAHNAFFTYHAEVFHMLRTSTPKLYSNILKTCSNLIDIYQNLFQLNELRGTILNLAWFKDFESQTHLRNLKMAEFSSFLDSTCNLLVDCIRKLEGDN
jgi:hypothetical protein